MTLTDTLRFIHISAGITSLLTLFLPLFLPKGGKAHRRIGWVFVIAMGCLCASAGPLALYRLFTSTNRGVLIGAAFLFYITILSFDAVWHGIRVLRNKGLGVNNNPWDLSVSGMLALSGVATIAMGAAFSTPLLVVFGAFGLYTGIQQVRTLRNAHKEKMHWWFGHMGGMLGASTASLTAFLVINSQRLGLGSFSLTVWLLPSAILVPVSIVWTRYYRRKFGLTPSKAESSMASPLASARRPATISG